MSNGSKLSVFILIIGFFFYLSSSLLQAAAIVPLFSAENGNWKLVWSDEFDYTNAELDTKWESQNGPSGHILCSRWRDNALVSNGTLKLINKKEQRGGQNWTSGNIWTKEKFKYGYFECRYKYAAAPATNNSFWLMTRGSDPSNGKRFEIDINEGHFPNKLNTNIHNWGDITIVNCKKTHPSSSKRFNYGVQPGYTIQLEIPVTTRRVRLTSNNSSHFHINEFRIYNVNPAGYPDPLSETADTDIAGLVNYARNSSTKITVSDVYKSQNNYSADQVVEGKLSTYWVTQTNGHKWIEFELAKEKTIGCVQFVNGWKDKKGWNGLVSDYKVQYQNGKEWVDLSVFDISTGDMNLAKDFHVYGLEWTEGDLIFYFDGKPIRCQKNGFCYSPAPIWLSLAIISWGGSITGAIDGTIMEVDYVRVYQRK